MGLLTFKLAGLIKHDIQVASKFMFMDFFFFFILSFVLNNDDEKYPEREIL